MSERGVFAVDRGIFDHPVFADEPFTEREAWTWMIGEAAWKARRCRVGTAVVSLARGELAHSIRFLADKWRWHRAKVERFLKRLKTETMIETRTETGVTVIRLCKYDEYQRVSLPSETAAETQSETAPRQQRDREEDIKPIEDTSSLRSDVVARKLSAKDELRVVLDEERATAVIEHRQKLRKPLTARAAKMLAANLARWRGGANEAADAMIASAWVGFEPEWLANRRPVQATNGSGSPSPPKDREEAEIRLRVARNRQAWPRDRWGPAPNEPGCLIPAELIRPDDGKGWAEWQPAH